MPIAVNDKGEVIFLTPEGQWQPAQVAENPQTKERLAYDGKDWKPMPAAAPAAAAPGPPAAAGPSGIENVLQTTKDASSQYLKGVPVLGAFVDQAGAAVSAAANPVTGAGAPGETFGERYDQNLRGNRDAAAKFEGAHPWASTGLKVGGGVASMLALARIPGVAPLLGLTGPMALRIPMGALSGGGISVADALARGENPLVAGGIGTAIGAGAPMVGKVAGGVYDRVAEALTKSPAELAPLTRGARQALVDTQSPGTPARLAELGPDAMMFEGNPASFRLAQAIAAREPGAAQARMVDAVTTRDQGATGRLKADVENNFGPYQEPGALAARIDEELKQTAKQYAGVAGTMQQRLDPSRIVGKLDEAIATEAGASQKALKEARGYFNAMERDVDPTTGAVTYKPSDKLKTEIYELHRVRMALDDLGEQLAATPKAQALVGMLRKELDAIMPAPMKAVDKQMEDLFRQKDALGIGQSKILRTGPEAMTPEGLQALETSGGHAGGAMSPGQADMLKAGTRADVERLVGTNANDVAALRKAVGGEGDWNRDKLAQIFGQAEADKVIAAVDREAAFKTAVQKLRDGSETAMRAGAAKYVDKTVAPEGTPIPPFWERAGQLPEWLLRKGGGFIRDELSGAAKVRGDEGLANVLTTMGPQRDRVVDALIDYSARRQATAPQAATADRIAQLLAFNARQAVPRQGGSAAP